MTNRKPTCIAPFENILIDVYERVKPCSVYKPKTHLNINNYFDSEEIKELQRAHLFDDVLPEQCSVCANNEANFGGSLRDSKQVVYDYRNYNVGKFFLESILIQTSNACNLRCMPCDYASFPRLKELEDLKYIPRGSNIGLVKFNSNSFSSLLNILENYNVLRISILGGEPFYDKVTFEFVDELIKSNLSKNLTLHFTTNLTNLNSKKIEDIKKSFQDFILDCSIDGVGVVNEYLRFPSKWNEILNGLKMLKDLNQSFNIRTAFSNLALLRYPELITWALENNLDNLYLCSVDDPKIMNPQRLPIGLQDLVNKKYESLLNLDVDEITKQSIEVAMGYATNLDETDFKKSLEFFKKHDTHRGTNLLEVFPELKPYV